MKRSRGFLTGAGQNLLIAKISEDFFLKTLRGHAFSKIKSQGTN